MIVARYVTYNVFSTDDSLLARKRQYPALTLIGMDPNTILGKHQNDFNQFLLGDLSLEEVRCLYCLYCMCMKWGVGLLALAGFTMGPRNQARPSADGNRSNVS